MAPEQLNSQKIKLTRKSNTYLNPSEITRHQNGNDPNQIGFIPSHYPKPKLIDFVEHPPNLAKLYLVFPMARLIGHV